MNRRHYGCWILLIFVPIASSACREVRDYDEYRRRERHFKSQIALLAAVRDTLNEASEPPEGFAYTCDASPTAPSCREQIAQCKPALTQMRSTSDRSKQSKIYAKMSDICTRQHWVRKRCEIAVVKMHSTKDGAQRNRSMEDDLTACENLLGLALSRDEVKRGLHATRRGVLECGRRHAIEGTVLVKLQISNQRAVFQQTDRGPQAFAQCTATALERARFRRAPALTVTYPYLLDDIAPLQE